MGWEYLSMPIESHMVNQKSLKYILSRSQSVIEKD